MSERSQRNRQRLRNALTLLVEGRLSPPYRAPFEVVFQDRVVALRRYGAVGAVAHEGARPILLVPPLMVTSEIYDISPELSAVAFLAAAGVPTYVADFGAPEAQEGGLDRTLDDHVLAVSRCIDCLRQTSGHDVHLVGYSQGGMFCYQTAAYRKSQGVASLVTFGSPVDIRRNVPFKLNDALTERLVASARRLIARPLAGLRGVPGTMSSLGFKLFAPVQEVRHLVQLLGVLHDEEALARLEPKRRFLGGEGFIAWPGPALRMFIDEFVVNNRMKQGGFVIAGRTVALADIASPICYVVGEEDDIAQPDAVRAIRAAAPKASSYAVHVSAGHFGLVVGRAAMSVCWPTVLAWSAWHDGRGPRPAILDSADEASPDERRTGISGALAEGADAVWKRLGKSGVRLGRAFDALRWQLFARRGAGASLAQALHERAATTPDGVCFLFAGRAFAYAGVDRRIDAIAGALARAGVGVGRRVALGRLSSQDLVGAAVALNRLGAVVVALEHGDLEAAEVTLIVGEAPGAAAHIPRLALEREPEPVESDFGASRGPSTGLNDVALVLDHGEETNGQWLAHGLTFASTARLAPGDTIYCPPLPARALLMCLAGALVGGARLQLSDRRPAPGLVWDELFNTGASVVVADDELARALADAPAPARHPVRLVLGVGLASEVAEALIDRLGARTRFRIL